MKQTQNTQFKKKKKTTTPTLKKRPQSHLEEKSQRKNPESSGPNEFSSPKLQGAARLESAFPDGHLTFVGGLSLHSDPNPRVKGLEVIEAGSQLMENDRFCTWQVGVPLGESRGILWHAVWGHSFLICFTCCFTRKLHHWDTFRVDMLYSALFGRRNRRWNIPRSLQKPPETVGSPIPDPETIRAMEPNWEWPPILRRRSRRRRSLRCAPRTRAASPARSTTEIRRMDGRAGWKMENGCGRYSNDM